MQYAKMMLFLAQRFKDATNQPQILQNVKYTKLINIAKGFSKYCDK